MAEEVEVLPEENRDSFSFFRVVGPRYALSFEPIRTWLNDENHPGFYCFGGCWLAAEGNFSPQDCIEVAITDPDVAFSFKMRWV